MPKNAREKQGKAARRNPTAFKAPSETLVDPPTFSNSKAMGKSTWSVQRDHVRLLAYAVRMLAPGGTVVFSCNLRNFRPDLEGLPIEDPAAYAEDVCALMVADAEPPAKEAE